MVFVLLQSDIAVRIYGAWWIARPKVEVSWNTSHRLTPPKHWHPSTKPHGITIHTTTVFIFNIMHIKTSCGYLFKCVCSTIHILRKPSFPTINNNKKTITSYIYLKSLTQFNLMQRKMFYQYK
jgi:hypothetical protein